MLNIFSILEKYQLRCEYPNTFLILALILRLFLFLVLIWIPQVLRRYKDIQMQISSPISVCESCWATAESKTYEWIPFSKKRTNINEEEANDDNVRATHTYHSTSQPMLNINGLIKIDFYCGQLATALSVLPLLFFNAIHCGFDVCLCGNAIFGSQNANNAMHNHSSSRCPCLERLKFTVLFSEEMRRRMGER